MEPTTSRVLEAPNAAATTHERTMKAVTRSRYGSADVLQVAETDLPAVGDEDVLVRVRAASLDRGTWHIMAGEPYLIRIAGYGLRAPKTAGLGSDMAGVIEAVGVKVTAFRPGDAVFGIARDRAAFAEYTIARPGKLARMPANLTFEQAAAVPVSGLTALQALRDRGHLQAGQHVLIIGASGGVGMFAVQIAKSFGAEVTGVCSTAKVDMVRSLGADHVIDYTQTDITRASERYDLVLDIGGNRSLSALRRMLTRTGTLVLVGGEDGGRWFGGLSRQLGAMLLSPFIRQRLTMLIASENSKDLETLSAMLESGAVTPSVERVASLAGVPEAIRDLAAGKVRGKIVITP